MMEYRRRRRAVEIEDVPLQEQRQAAVMRSYTTPAIITFALYCLFWLPGFIANIVYLQAAQGDHELLDYPPQGKGCLTALFIVFAVLPGFGLFSLCILSAIGASR